VTRPPGAARKSKATSGLPRVVEAALVVAVPALRKRKQRPRQPIVVSVLGRLIGLPLKKSCGVDSIAFLTASSNRSNSTSLIALLEGAEIPNVRIVISVIIDTHISGQD
jgi:hypothetical protein